MSEIPVLSVCCPPLHLPTLVVFIHRNPSDDIRERWKKAGGKSFTVRHLPRGTIVVPGLSGSSPAQYPFPCQCSTQIHIATSSNTVPAVKSLSLWEKTPKACIFSSLPSP